MSLSAEYRNRNPGGPEEQLLFDTLYENDYNKIGCSAGNHIIQAGDRCLQGIRRNYPDLAIIPRVLQSIEQQNEMCGILNYCSKR